MMVTDVTKFHKYHLGERSMLECVCVCVRACRIYIGLDFEFWEGGGGGRFQSSILTWRRCIAHNS